MTTDPRVLAIWAEGLGPSGWIMGPGLPWGHIAADMQHFRERTRNRILIMGRTTFESLPDSMKTPQATFERPLVILTNGSAYAVGDTLNPDGYWWVGRGTSAAQVLRETTRFTRATGVAVIGGPKVIEFMEPVTDRLYVSTIRGHHSGDVPAPEDKYLRQFESEKILGAHPWGHITQYDREVPHTEEEGDTE